MNTRWIAALLLAIACPSAVWSQSALQFRWQKGQILTYKVVHSTTVTEVLGDGKQEFASRLDLTKRYRVADVDAKGVATLEYSVTAMRNKQKRPNGEILLFDSAEPEKSTPGLREQLGKYVGTTLAVLRVDAAGQVVEVKQGPADRYGAEPPFAIVLPGSALKVGQTWLRNFDLTLDPPLGTGEKYKAQQECRCKKVDGGKFTVVFLTSFKTMPETVQERIPLLQKEVEGEVVFDMNAGRVADVRLVVDRTLANHQGPGSSYHFESTYEQHVTE